MSSESPNASATPSAPASAPKESALAKSIKSFISGGFGGVSLVLVGHPFDLVKVRLQTGAAYRGTLDGFRQIVAAEGLPGLYRGMGTPLVGITPVFAICFWGYDLGQVIDENL